MLDGLRISFALVFAFILAVWLQVGRSNESSSQLPQCVCAESGVHCLAQMLCEAKWSSQLRLRGRCARRRSERFEGASLLFTTSIRDAHGGFFLVASRFAVFFLQSHSLLPRRLGILLSRSSRRAGW